MRGIAGTRRVGHLGTLDPLATGVLPVMVGRATRLARFWEGSEKAYEAVVRFGFATSTFDREGETVGPISQPNLNGEQIEALLAPMRGEILQTPPPVSAKKVNGVPAYKLARKNVAVELAPVNVWIYELTLRALEGDRARIFVRCSPGTYVRTIAHELGLALGCGAHIDELVRTASGPFVIAQAFTLERLQQLKDEGRLREALLKPPDLLPQFPVVFLDDVTVRQIRQGRDFTVSPFRVNAGAEHVKAIGPDGELAAIGRIVLPHIYHPVVVLSAQAAERGAKPSRDSSAAAARGESVVREFPGSE
jgi:tRNA pseudouridine55 synthase